MIAGQAVKLYGVKKEVSGVPQVNAGLPYHSNRQNVLWNSLVNTSRADSIYTAHYFNTQSLNFSALPPPSSAASTQDGPNMAQLQAQANVYADLSQLSDAPNCPWYVLICGLACCMLHAARCMNGLIFEYLFPQSKRDGKAYINVLDIVTKSVQCVTSRIVVVAH